MSNLTLGQWGLTLILWLVLVGCSATEPGLARLAAEQQQYLLRLARVLEQELQPVDWYPLPAAPRSRDLLEPIAEQQIDWLDLLTLNQCELGPLIGYRNSGLGRVLTTSERWRYERQLLQRLQGCEPAGDERELFETLTQLKRQQLPRLRYNALLAGPEWRALVSVQALAGDADLAAAQTASLEQALYELARLGRREGRRDAQALGARESSEPWPGESELYEPLQTLRFSNAGGELRRTWRRQTLLLTAAADLLEGAQAAPLCLTGQPTPRARNLLGVFTTYYVEQIQPELSLLPQPDRGWLQALDQLVTGVVADVQRASVDGAGPSAALLGWHRSVFSAQRGSEFDRWRRAVDRHSQAWRWHLEQCNLLPQPSATGLRE